MNSQCHYLVVDAFPHTEGGHFRECAGASIGCWVRLGQGDPRSLVRHKLLREGWEVASVVAESLVDARRYESNETGRVEFEQAVAAGFAAHVHTRAREILTRSDSVSDSAASLIVEYATTLCGIHEHAHSLLLPAERQWANGVTPDGDDFLPLWPDRAGAIMWQQHWPDHLVVAVPLSDLVGEQGLLVGVEGEDMWIALGIRNVLVTAHPCAIARDLLATL